jgi:hypothetical protein
MSETNPERAPSRFWRPLKANGGFGVGMAGTALARLKCLNAASLQPFNRLANAAV